MTKKLSLSMTAAAVLAFAVPAAANAATGLTEGSALVTTGKIITGTNVGVSTVTSTKIGNTTCATGTVMTEGELTVNSASEVKAELGAAKSYFASCLNTNHGTTAVRDTLSLLKTNGGGSGTFTISFEFENIGGLICTFTGTNDTFNYNPTETAEGGKIITVSSQALSGTPAVCGPAKLDGSYELTTGGTTTPVFLM